MGGFARVQAAGAEAALVVLDQRLEGAESRAERVAAFEAAYRRVTEWRYQVAAGGRWPRPDSHPEDVLTPIRHSKWNPVMPDPRRQEEGSPAFKYLAELQKVAWQRLADVPEMHDGVRELQNVVTLRDGRTMNGNLLHFVPLPADQDSGQAMPSWQLGSMMTQTAVEPDREVLRRMSFETLAELEEGRAALEEEQARAENGGALEDAGGAVQGAGRGTAARRQAFVDAAYFLVQAPEFNRGSDAVMRTFLVAAHTRVFGVAPVLPQGIDLDGMVRGQDGFNQVMDAELRVLPGPQQTQSVELNAGNRTAAPPRARAAESHTKDTGRH